MSDNYVNIFYARNYRTEDTTKIPLMLTEFINNNNFRMKACSAGERIFLSRSDSTAEPCLPCAYCVVYVCRLIKECTEHDLFKLFSIYGQISEIRMMIDKDGYCRGYAFIRYEKALDACNAVEKCNGRSINNVEGSKLFQIRVSHSLGPILLVTGIPLGNSDAILEQVFRQCLQGIMDVIIPRNLGNAAFNRGYLFLTFNSFENAAAARAKIWYNKTSIWYPLCLAEWALPKMPDETVTEHTLDLELRCTQIPVLDGSVNSPSGFFGGLSPYTIQFD